MIIGELIVAIDKTPDALFIAGNARTFDNQFLIDFFFSTTNYFGTRESFFELVFERGNKFPLGILSADIYLSVAKYSCAIKINLLWVKLIIELVCNSV